MASGKSPVLYIAVGAAVIIAAVMLTTPQTTTQSGVVAANRSGKTAGGADVASVKFARYAGTGRNAFDPQVVSGRTAAYGGRPWVVGSGGTWRLTGISVVNGSRIAVVENDATKEAMELQSGQKWDGLLVQSIDAVAVALRDRKNHVTKLSFPDPAEAAGGDIKNEPVRPVPAATGVQPLRIDLSALRGRGMAIERKAN
jgi:hypothetical protein